MQEEFDDPGAVPVEVLLEVHDGAIPSLPDGPVVAQLGRESLAVENLRMHAGDQHLLVIGPVEDADVPPFRQAVRRAPEKIMSQLLGARRLEAENLAALGIDAGHHMLDGAILARGIHPLKDNQKGIPVVGIKKPLLPAQLAGMLLQQSGILLLRPADGLHPRGPLLELHFFPGRNLEVLGIDFHMRPFAKNGLPRTRESTGWDH